MKCYEMSYEIYFMKCYEMFMKCLAYLALISPNYALLVTYCHLLLKTASLTWFLQKF